MQELDADVAALLRELVEFLECLGEVELPEPVGAAREALLQRSRAAAAAAAVEEPEPYLDMNAGKGVQLLLEAEQPQEYVHADAAQFQMREVETPGECGQRQQRGSQHYYETFQEAPREPAKAPAPQASLSGPRARELASRCGPLLHLKRERRMFAPLSALWLNRSYCWAALVGAHLLVYGSEREARAYLALPLRGYKGRAAPGAVARDPRRSEAAFELYCPGERTLQFLAADAREMRAWLEDVERALEPESRPPSRPATFAEILELESNERICMERVKEEKERQQEQLGSPKSKPKQVDAPPLPARSRRLPSLPSRDHLTSEPREDLYDEEGLYQRIEDLKSQREYQNCRRRSRGDLAQETYDDADSATGTPSETYDDVRGLSTSGGDESVSYDDVHSTGAADSPKAKPAKAAHKRSFFERVRQRKESTRKAKSPTPAASTASPAPPAPALPPADPEPEPEIELPSYDDAASCAAATPNPEEDYLSPPPPRPIYSRPPTVIKCALPPEDIYDDIGACIEVNGNGCRGCANVDVIKNYPKNGSFLSDLQLSIDHYQVPKANNRCVLEHQEELYDDVALSETFKNRPRDSLSSPEKSVWSRFGSAKKLRIFDHVGRQSSIGDTTDSTASDELAPGTDPQQQQSKVKPIQKLISKMETTLGMANKANGAT